MRLRSLALVLPALLPSASCSTRGDDGRPDLTLYFTGTVNGYIEPCGCVAGQIGGIDRIAGYLEQEMRGDPNALFVDAGDLFAEDLDVNEQVKKQLPLKADAFFSVWSGLGCEAIALGEQDLFVLGVPRLKELSERHDLPILCGNLFDASGEQVFPSYIIVERGGKRIGIFSLLAPKLKEAKVDDAERVEIAARVAREGLELRNWRARAQAIVSELLPQTDMILCASHLGYDLNRWLAESFPQVDLVFGGHFGTAEKERYVVGNTPVLISLVRGSRVDRVQWWWPDEDAYFVDADRRREQGPGKLIDASKYAELAVQQEVQFHEHEGMLRRQMLYTPEVYEEKLGDKRALLLQAERNVQAEGEPPNVNRFTHVQTPMHRDLPRSELALRAIDKYHLDTRELWGVDENADRQFASAVYAGPDACIDCHPRQYDFWLATRHSFALSALEASGQEVDAECFYCHTVGFRMGGGFKRPGRHQGFENVQCAACHGPGTGHIAGGPSYLDPNYLNPSGADTCAACHNKEHDPNFERDRWMKLQMVGCPPLEPVAERTAPMLAATAIAADVLASQRRPRWAEVVSAYYKAGMTDASIAAAERWVEAAPGQSEPRLRLGELLQTGGRHEEARQHFEFAVEKDPEDPRAWLGLGRSLITLDPEAAVVAAREAYSLEVGTPTAIRLIADTYLAQNRRAAASEVARGFLEQYPHFAWIFADVVEVPPGNQGAEQPD